MSLDVYLEIGERNVEKCHYCGGTGEIDHGRHRVYASNITHNLSRMAREAGIYECLWRPEEVGITKADQLIEPLGAGLELLRSDPKRFKKFDAPNGWGRYENFAAWVAQYLAACRKHPKADVRASR